MTAIVLVQHLFTYSDSTNRLEDGWWRGNHGLVIFLIKQKGRWRRLVEVTQG
jgi:hypothetical protein